MKVYVKGKDNGKISTLITDRTDIYDKNSFTSQKLTKIGDWHLVCMRKR